MKRILVLLPVLLALQVGVSPALAWTWPVDGPVLRPFAFDAENPYAGGQHRGVDIGAPTGTAVVAPAGGTVTFAGTVPRGGLTLAIATPDGYSATLVHLGTITVSRGATVAEGEAVGSVGPTGEPDLTEPHVHLGIRVAAQAHAYVDPLSLLPARAAAPPAVEDETGRAPEEPAGAGGTTPDGDTSASKGGGGKAAPAARPVVRASTRAPERRVRIARPVSVAGSSADRLASREAPVAAHMPAMTRRSAAAPAPLTAGAAAAEREVEPVPAAREPGKRPRPPADGGGRLFPAALVAASLAAVAGLAACRQLRDARVAHGSTAMLLKPVTTPAEDTRFVRPREDDEILVDRDLERILLAQAEALADLDRDDDAAELVDVPDDAHRSAAPACRRRSPAQRRSRSHQRPPTLSPAGR